MLGLLIAACFMDDPFVVTDYAYPAFVVTERPDAARADVKAEVPPAPKAAPQYRLDMYTASWCGPCRDWKNSYLKQVEAAGFPVNLIDIDQVRNTGVNRVPQFRLMEGDKELGRWTGHVGVSTLQGRIGGRSAASTPSKPFLQPGLYGRTGTSHESRETLISHLLEDGIHAGRHTRAELSKMSDESLNDLHNREHDQAGHVVDSRGLWRQ